MVVDVVGHFKLHPLLVLYDEEESILSLGNLSDDVSRVHGIVPTKFTRILRDDDEQKTL
jgi:hypothetical protein